MQTPRPAEVRQAVSSRQFLRSLLGCVRAASRQRRVQVALGLLWVLDGVLQLQPAMFGRGFVATVLIPSAAGNPAVVAGPIVSIADFLAPHIALWNALFALTQLLIGLGLLVRRTVRAALVASFVWSLAVWWLAEGLGGLLTGRASPLNGAPGAVLLYLFVGLVAWPKRDELRVSGPISAAAHGLLGERCTRICWGILWVGSAGLLLQPVNLSPSALGSVFSAAASGQPGWLSAMVARVGGALMPDAVPLSVGLAIVMCVVGIGVVLDWHNTGLLSLAVVVSLAIWILGEGMGGILTGTGTDPNTGPLLVLAALALYRPADAAVRREPARLTACAVSRRGGLGT